VPQVPSKVAARLSSAIKRFQPIIASAKSRDANESDTVIIVTDMLSEVFGYDKYSEITSECSIRGTWCDLAIKIDGTFEYLIEVKAIGLELKDSYTNKLLITLQIKAPIGYFSRMRKSGASTKLPLPNLSFRS